MPMLISVVEDGEFRERELSTRRILFWMDHPIRQDDLPISFAALAGIATFFAEVATCS